MLMFFAVEYLKAEKKFFLSNIASQQKSLTNLIEITTFVLRMIPIFLTFFLACSEDFEGHDRNQCFHQFTSYFYQCFILDFMVWLQLW